MKEFVRKDLFNKLWNALHTPINLIQVITGPRQVGKTTLALQVLAKWENPKIYETGDLPITPGYKWIINLWEKARGLYKSTGEEVLLVLDEVQKTPQWSNVIKALFDEDKRRKIKIRVVILGSSALLVQRGLTESLAGRFEIHRHNHWTFPECKDCFSVDLDEYIYFGGYPGALPIRKDQERWTRYIRDALIETVISKDVLLMMPVTKPALLRQVFGLSVSHPAEVLSYQKMLGQLLDAGNTTTIASHLRLLSNAFLVTCLERYSGSKIRQRGSIPKILVLDNSLVVSMSNINFKEARTDSTFWGRLIENLAGSRLYTLLQEMGGKLFYWRERNNEVDYVIKLGDKLIAIEVKSTPFKRDIPNNLIFFTQRYKKVKPVIISKTTEIIDKNITHITLQDFFTDPKKILEL